MTTLESLREAASSCWLGHTHANVSRTIGGPDNYGLPRPELMSSQLASMLAVAHLLKAFENATSREEREDLVRVVGAIFLESIGDGTVPLATSSGSAFNAMLTTIQEALKGWVECVNVAHYEATMMERSRLDQPVGNMPMLRF